MDFSVIFQLRNKKFWWMDVIFYFAISLLVATVFSYFILLVKDNIQREEIKKEAVFLQGVGTQAQKNQEKYVIDYRNKIGDFTTLFKNHEFASNVFAFMRAQTVPNVWFKQFNLNEKNNDVQLSGESDDLNAISGQVSVFEKNKYVKSIGTLNSTLGQSAKTEFNIDLVLDQSIFSYLSDLTQIPEAATSTGQLTANNGSLNPATGSQQVLTANSSEKMIISFHLPLKPEVAGILSETNHTITLNVPYGTDIKNLAPTIVVSPGAEVLPASGVSQDFISPVTYMVTASDGSVQNYTVNVVESKN